MQYTQRNEFAVVTRNWSIISGHGDCAMLHGLSRLVFNFVFNYSLEPRAWPRS